MSPLTRAPLSLNIAVIGAGVGGLAAAHCLAQSGHRVTVYESAKQLGEIGAGLHISPNVTRLMIRWGLGQKLAEVCVAMQRFSIHNWQTGERIEVVSLGKVSEDLYGAPHYAIHRADLHTLIHDLAAPNIEIRLDSKVVAIDPTTPTFTLHNGEVVHADLIIGADGIKSALRDSVIEKSAPLIPSGVAAYRTTVSAKLMREDPSLSELLDQEETSVWMGPNKRIIGYPIRSKKEYNLVMLHPVTGTPGLLTRADASIKQMQEDFKGWDLRLEKLLTMVDTLMDWRLSDIDPLETWVHKDGKATLLGDAAHAMLPYRAQGAAMAIEDAAVLGKLFSYVTTQAQIKPLLEAYNELRNPRASATQSDSRATRMSLNPRETVQPRPALGNKDGAQAEGKDADSGSKEQPGNASWLSRDGNKVQYEYDADAEVEKWWSAKGKSVLASL